MSKTVIGLIVLLSVSIFFQLPTHAYVGDFTQDAADDPNPPASPVRLIFIHHSTGENWLADENGGLGIALRDNNYFVSDTNYDWGPDAIGSLTDTGHWWLWLRGPDSSKYLDALYAESEQHSAYSRMESGPDGENEIVMFKSCFPNSALQGDPNDVVPQIDSNPLRGQDSWSEFHKVANAKGIYIDLLDYFQTRQDKLFIVITAPPQSDPTYADNARAFNEWLMHDWLQNYPYNNVFVFDFYNVLTTNGGSPSVNDLNQETGNHHRWWHDAVQHKTDGDHDGNPNVLEYPTEDDHPSRAGNLKATAEFLPLLNVAYNRWDRSYAASTTHVAETSVQLTTVQTTTPETETSAQPSTPVSGTFSIEYVLVAVVILAVVIAIVALAMRRRHAAPGR
jgi:hypothetical protein